VKTLDELLQDDETGENSTRYSPEAMSATRVKVLDRRSDHEVP
jgi:hypothetical protein